MKADLTGGELKLQHSRFMWFCDIVLTRPTVATRDTVDSELG